MKIAVTGGSGFIGAATVADLEGRGHEAVVIDRVSGTDILDQGSVKRIMKGCDGVIHLAGVLGTEELFANPHNAIDVNIKGTVNVLLACESASASFVGITMPQVWDNVYQATKNCAGRLALAYMRHREVPVSFVRAYNAFGRGQHVHGVQKIVPTFATRAWRGQALPIWGDGNQTVDLVYVDDVARMLVDALDYGKGETFDAATGVDLTVNEVANMVLEHVDNPKAHIEYLPMRAGEHPVILSADGDGWDYLDWRPLFRSSDLARTVDWYREDRP